MKLTELFESKFKPHWSDLIRRDCKPFLSAVKKPLLRGVASDTERSENERDRDGPKNLSPSLMRKQIDKGVFIGAVRNDRMTRDSNEKLVDAMNKFFKLKTGLQLRNSALFCTFDYDVANRYGRCFAIFPIGEFHYSWSPVIHDPTVTFKVRNIKDWPPKLGAVLPKIEKDLNFEDGIKSESAMMEVAEEFYEKHADDFYFFDSDIKRAYSTSAEIMVVCDKYYAVDFELLNKSGFKF